VREKNVYVIWSVYFNSDLSRREGRRVSKSLAVTKPNIEEIIESCKKIGFEVIRVNPSAKYPRCWWYPSGYVIVRKKEDVNKRELLKMIAKELRRMRG